MQIRGSKPGLFSEEVNIADKRPLHYAIYVLQTPDSWCLQNKTI